MKQHIINVALAVSLILNILIGAVLLDDEELISQYSEAVQYLGCECNTVEEQVAQGLCLKKLW